MIESMFVCVCVQLLKATMKEVGSVARGEVSDEDIARAKSVVMIRLQ